MKPEWISTNVKPVPSDRLPRTSVPFKPIPPASSGSQPTSVLKAWIGRVETDGEHEGGHEECQVTANGCGPCGTTNPCTRIVQLPGAALATMICSTLSRWFGPGAAGSFS